MFRLGFETPEAAYDRPFDDWLASTGENELELRVSVPQEIDRRPYCETPLFEIYDDLFIMHVSAKAAPRMNGSVRSLVVDKQKTGGIWRHVCVRDTLYRIEKVEHQVR